MKLPATLSLLCLCLSQAFAGQTPPADPVAENLFPPELVMQHQLEIKLTEDQRNALMAEIQKTQGHLADLQRRLQKEVDALGVLLKKDAVDEQGALAQLDRVLKEEREIKRAHLALVLGIKNKLTIEQEVKLREIKSKIAAGQLPSPEAVQREKGYKPALRIAIITARNAPSNERVVTTLNKWGINIDETFFLGGIEKKHVLGVLRPHIFFDDQLKHLEGTADTIASVHIPFGIANGSMKGRK